MKKSYWKIIFISIGVTLILAIGIFGAASLFAPAAMMDLTASIGLTGISGDYAFQEYERSGSVSCLARSFIVSAELKHDRTAKSRFDAFYELDEFGAFCEEQDKTVEIDGAFGEYSYRNYVCGLAAQVDYRLASSAEEEAGAVAFAASETERSFPKANPLIALAVEASNGGDAAFCTLLLREMRAGGYEENPDFLAVVTILQRVIEA